LENGYPAFQDHAYNGGDLENNMSKRWLLGAVVAALPCATMAQDFPSRPVSMVVAAAAGGPIDVFTRIMAERMSPILGQRVVVENVGGGGGTLGGQRVAHAAPDGYTTFWAPCAPTPIRNSMRQAAVRPAQRSHAGGADRGNSSGGDRAQRLPASTFQEFMTYAKANPGQAELRLGWRRLGLASRLRHARPGDGHQRPARARIAAPLRRCRT
jgi:hypothetical protein